MSSEESYKEEDPPRRAKRRGRKAQTPKLPKIQPVKSSLSAEFLIPSNDPRCWVAFAIAKSRFKRKLGSTFQPSLTTTTTTPSFQLANSQLTTDISFHSLLFEPNTTMFSGLSEESKIELGQALAFRMFHLEHAVMSRLEREAVWELVGNALLSLQANDVSAIAIGMLQELQACITKGWLETKLFALNNAYSICDYLQRLAPQQEFNSQVNTIIHLLQQRSARAQGDRHEMLTLRLLALCC